MVFNISDSFQNANSILNLNGLATGVILIIIGISLKLYFIDRKEKIKDKESIAKIKSLLLNADSLVRKDMTIAALSEYKSISKMISPEKYPNEYAHIKNGEGVCCLNLSKKNNKEENLTIAIRAFEEALKIRTIGKFPVDYAETQKNLGESYRRLAEVRDKEENLELAIHAFNESLKIRTCEKFPLDYAKTQSNIGYAYKVLALLIMLKPKITSELRTGILRM